MFLNLKKKWRNFDRISLFVLNVLLCCETVRLADAPVDNNATPEADKLESSEWVGGTKRCSNSATNQRSLMIFKPAIAKKKKEKEKETPLFLTIELPKKSITKSVRLYD